MNNLKEKVVNVSSDSVKKLRRKAKKIKTKKGSGTIILIVLFIIMGTITFFTAKGIFKAGSLALFDSYSSAYDSEKEEAYNTQYSKYYEMVEAKHHVSNRVSVEIGDLKETAALEVLRVNDIEYITVDENDNDDGITAWLEVPGQGTYVVNLQVAEFTVDSERLHVLVRVPYPELTNITIDYANVKKLLFKNAWSNDSVKVGEELAYEMLNSADILIRKEFASNQNFYLSAQKAAISTMQCLVKQLNPGVTDLTVDVEFY